ncbi:polyprenyl synthetase family protein [uncultured Veillonella sp.]|uniref:polyprenyl synthetase family protein n=1 Tax=uncultured Veillonella sp. TaxID=159268 RepID=UPI00260A21CA|nr:farnesyl diphosphate synthase [uncultured Veillonella sp.]
MLKAYLKDGKAWTERFLATALTSPCEEYNGLYESMKYSLMMGGKRIRPILTKAVMESLGVDPEPYKEIVCAIELIHTYSLIHDDLPAMDNDDYRRGNLTNHKVYGDGMAILAGDGLNTFAFELMGQNTVATAEQKNAAIVALAKAAGPSGMVGGQAFDLSSEGHNLSLKELQVLHKGKTGALFLGAIEIGLILANAAPHICEKYRAYGDQLGLLFQITDDILDVTGTIEDLGKMPGSDEKMHKATYVSILGEAEARKKAEEVGQLAKAALSDIDGDISILTGLVDYLLHRTN